MIVRFAPPTCLLAPPCVRRPGHDLDDQFDLVGQERVEVDEGLSRDAPGSRMSDRMRVFWTSRPRFASNSAPRACSAPAFFASTRRLVTSEMSDGSRCTWSGKRSIRRGKLDASVVEAADEFVELLLRRHHDPVLAAPLDAELLDDRLEVQHLLDVAGDELPDLVDDEHQRLGRACGAS